MNRSPTQIAVEVTGGVGNQLFQFAAGLEVVDGLVDRVRLATSADCELLRRILGLAIERASPWVMVLGGVGPATPTRWVPKKARQFFSSLGRRSGVVHGRKIAPWPSERHGSSEGQIWRRGRWAFARGYFQDPKWSARHSEIVAELIMRTVARRATSGEATSPVVHVRGGDYRGLGWILDDQYYRNVIESGFLTPSDRACIVGNDQVEVTRVRDILHQYDVETTALAPLPDPLESAIRDFSAIAVAPRVVMSNSTFCWWATRAGDTASPLRRVAYPSGWIDGSSQTRLSRSLLMPRWETFPS